MKRVLSLACATLLSVGASAQQIKSSPIVFDDFRAVLEVAGFEAYSFDLREFLAESGRYDITMIVKEYADGKEVNLKRHGFGSNKVLLSDFPEESRKEVTREEMADPDADVYTQAEKLVIGRFPSGVDSVAKWTFNMPNMGRMGRSLTLRSLQVPDSDRPFYSYHTRPFVIDKFEPGKFIPLLFYGSMWYDGKAKICRFCGEREIAPDLSSEIVAHVPHFYLIGLELTEKKERKNPKP